MIKFNIRVYLRASTVDQDPLRAKEEIIKFLAHFNLTPTHYYIEQVSGASLNRKELNRLIGDAQPNDIIVVEQVDRLTRLSSIDWKTLKATIENKELKIVSLDLPTSHLFLQKTDQSLVGDILGHVNTLLLEILATTARKDYEDRKRRQEQGIAKAKAAGKYKGRQQSPEKLKACEQALEFVTVNKLSKDKAAKAAGFGVATFYRYLKENNHNNK